MEFGDEPVGLHQLVQGEGGVVDTHLGLGDVHEGVENLLHHGGTKRGLKLKKLKMSTRNANFFYMMMNMGRYITFNIFLST